MRAEHCIHKIHGKSNNPREVHLLLGGVRKSVVLNFLWRVPSHIKLLLIKTVCFSHYLVFCFRILSPQYNKVNDGPMSLCPPRLCITHADMLLLILRALLTQVVVLWWRGRAHLCVLRPLGCGELLDRCQLLDPTGSASHFLALILFPRVKQQGFLS